MNKFISSLLFASYKGQKTVFFWCVFPVYYNAVVKTTWNMHRYSINQAIENFYRNSNYFILKHFSSYYYMLKSYTTLLSLLLSSILNYSPEESVNLKFIIRKSAPTTFISIKVKLIISKNMTYYFSYATNLIMLRWCKVCWSKKKHAADSNCEEVAFLWNNLNLYVHLKTFVK